MDSNDSQLRWFEVLPRCASIVGSALGALVLLGWIFDLEPLKRIAPGFVAMNPMTAVGFILMAICLWFSAGNNARKRVSQKLTITCSLLVIAMAGTKLAQLCVPWNPGVDELLFASKLGGSATSLPNRMAPNTAFNFFLLGSALFLICQDRFVTPVLAQVFVLIAGMISWIAVIGYIYGATSLYGVRSFIPMALHTAVLFLLSSVGILCLQPKRGFVGVVSDPGAGGQIARRVLPLIILVPSFFGWLRLVGEERQLYAAETGVALMVVSSIVFSVGVVLWAAAWLNRLDAERTRAEIKSRVLNEELSRHSEELQNANKELEAFSYSVSHDLRAPLRHIGGFVNLLKGESASFSPKNQRYLNIVSDSANQMGRLIDDLLTFSRLGRKEMQQAPVDLNVVLQETLSRLQSDLQNREIIWKKAALPQVCGDEGLLRQVLVNLIDNAVKYSRKKERAEIEIGYQETAKEHVIFVKDNGVGFDMQFAKKLFGVFQRLHHADEFEGTGIGLANVQRIIARHRGRVWVDAAVDKGATFYFSLPKPQKIL